MSAGEPRRLSAPLLLGMLTLPPVFVWLLLRRGYSADVRAGGLALAAFTLAIGLSRRAGF